MTAQPGLPHDDARRPVDESCARALFGALRLDGFFPEFSAELCAKVFPRSGVFDYPEGARLIEQDAQGRDVFVLLSGRVSVHQSMGSAAAEVGVFGPGDLLGEIALLKDGTRTATAVAVVHSRAFRLAFEDMGYLLTHHPALAEHLKNLARRRLA